MKILPIITCIILIIIDQITKYIAYINLKPIGDITVISGIFSITYVENRGMAFGMLEGARIFFIIITIIILIGIVYYYRTLPKNSVNKIVKIFLVLICSGAIGNLINRAFSGYVVDFFRVTFIDFPVFNVADIYVVVGTIGLAILTLFFMKDENIEKNN